MSHPVRDLAIAFTDAHEETLPRLTDRSRFTDREVKAYLFPQTWPTTALGFDQPGEVIATDGYTIVVLARIEYAAAVYFGCDLGYAVILKDKPVLDHFLASLRERAIPSCREAKELYGASYVEPVPLRRSQRRAIK